MVGLLPWYHDIPLNTLFIVKDEWISNNRKFIKSDASTSDLFQLEISGFVYVLGCLLKREWDIVRTNFPAFKLIKRMFCGYFKAVVLLGNPMSWKWSQSGIFTLYWRTDRKVPSYRKLRAIKEFNSEIKETCACSLRYSKVHP